MQTGDVIEGRYRLDRKLGEGGMAVVFLAHDMRLERPVAVKLLLAGDERERDLLREQFLREARLAAAVRHRNVVQILDFGTHEGRPFMVMEALEGESMADRLGRGEAFHLHEVVELALGCLDGLSAVHAAGVVHRDLKPENVFLVKDPSAIYPKLLDFGISKAVKKRGEVRSAVTTEEGLVLGTPEYMSPEQTRGLTDLDLRTDLYSLGVVMYEALAGAAPFESANPGDLIVMVIAGNAQPLVERVPVVGAELSAVVAKAMARDREQRYASAEEMRAALLAASASLPSVELPRHTRRSAASRDARDSLHQALAHIATATGTTTKPALTLPLIGFGLVFLLACGIALYALRAVRPSEARYIVVQSGASTPPPAASAAPAAATPPPPSTAMPAVPAVAPTAASSEAAPSEAAPAPRVRPHAPSKAAGGSDPATLVARSFDGQKASVARCLAQHPADVPAQGELAVRVSLSAEGAVSSAVVLPDALGATPTGSCIAAAVRAMRFPALPGPVVVRVPLTARRK